jgi:negative regulator of sigma E activity
MNCDWTEKISLLIDGELPDTEARAIQRHLIDCNECQQARADFLSLRSQISDYAPSLSPAAQAAALNRILGRRQAPVGITTPRPRWSLGWSFNPRVAAFASLLLLAAILGFVVYRATQDKTASPEVAKETSAPLPAPSPKASPADNGAGRQDRQARPNKPVQPKSNTPTTPRRTLRPPSDSIFATNRVEPNSANESVRAPDMQTLTAMHLQKSELLLRAFRNVRTSEAGRPAETGYERKLAQQLIVRNMMLKREADASGDVQMSSLLENLEPILLDIANLPDKAAADDIRVINERVERKNIVALLQVNSTVLARALDDDD